MAHLKLLFLFPINLLFLNRIFTGTTSRIPINNDIIIVFTTSGADGFKQGLPRTHARRPPLFKFKLKLKFKLQPQPSRGPSSEYKEYKV
jgi:hypothetical protein